MLAMEEQPSPSPDSLDTRGQISVIPEEADSVASIPTDKQ